MRVFLADLAACAVSGGLTYYNTGDSHVAAAVGVVCAILTWAVGGCITVEDDGGW